jgi:hypothetical protein
MQHALPLTRARFFVELWRFAALASTVSAVALTARAVPHAKLAPPAPTPIMAAANPVVASAEPPPSLARVHALADTADDAALDSLIALAERDAPEIARAALDGIVQIGGKRAREYLASRFADSPSFDLSLLGQSLAELGGPEARAMLFEAARSTRLGAREAARDAIATFDTPDARSFMLEELREPSPLQALAYFADCQDARAVPLLEHIARDATEDLRRSAISALFAQGESAREAVERLLRVGDEVSNDVLETTAAIASLRQAQRAASIARLRAGAITTGAVFDFLARDPSPVARAALVESAHDRASADSAVAALAARGDSASLAALAQLAGDPDPELARRAACAIISAPDSRSPRLLLRLGDKSPGEGAAALLQINAPEARGALARLQASPNAAARREADRLAAQYDRGS